MLEFVFSVYTFKINEYHYNFWHKISNNTCLESEIRDVRRMKIECIAT